MLMLRMLRIVYVFMRYGMDELLFAIPPFKQVRVLVWISPWHWYIRKQPRGLRIRKTLEALGPIFVKFGQLLSTRRDLLPADIASELSLLQDNVPPFSGKKARAIIETSLGQSIEQLFTTFSPEPLASASIAQVHTATLHDGKDVVVKVLRPNIFKTIKSDVALMYIMARLLEKAWADGKRLRAVEVVSEYEKTILDELDLMREAANASQLRRNFHSSSLLYIPDVYWDYVRREVIVMERIYGTPVSDVDTLRAKGVDIHKLAERGVEIFFTQAFKHNFFHADMHPGNIFVADNGQYIAVDFGIMGSLNREDQRYLAENLLAFFHRDYGRVATLHVESGWVPSDTRADEFEAAIRAVCEPIFERPISQISFGQLLVRLFQTARRFNMEVQPQLVLLQKTLLNIEGLGRTLYPELDLWTTAKPFLEKWMSEQVGIKAFANNLKKQLPVTLERLPELPLMTHGVLKQLHDGELSINIAANSLQPLQQELIKNRRSHSNSLLGTGLLICSALLLNTDTQDLLHLPQPWPSAGLAGLGLIILLRNRWLYR